MKKTKTLRIPLKVVFYKEAGRWIAHCLEFNLMGDGETKEQAIECLVQAINLQIEATLEYQNPANLFRPADGRYFQMFAAGKHVAIGELLLIRRGPVVIESTEAREYSDDELVPA